MKEEIYNETELKALEEEIRSYGIPYTKNEPDDRYFANFRVHLMERIDAKEEKQSVFSQAWSWISGSAIRTISIGTAFAAVIVAALMLGQSPKTEIAQIQPIQKTVVEQPAVITPTPIAPTLQKDVAAIPKVITKLKAVKNSELAVAVKTNKFQDAANGASDFAAMDESLTVGESDDPVNYENLSESELQSVVAIAQSMK